MPDRTRVHFIGGGSVEVAGDTADLAYHLWRADEGQPSPAVECFKDGGDPVWVAVAVVTHLTRAD